MRLPILGFILTLITAALPALAQRSTPVQLTRASTTAYGWSSAIDGDTIVTGGPGARVATVHRWNGSQWVLEATLTGAGSIAGDEFGRMTAISGNTIVIGTIPMSIPANQALYVFVRSGTTWTQQARITDPSGFGDAVAISGDTIVTGGYSKALVLTRSGTTWSVQARPTPSTISVDSWFGHSVAIDGDTIAIGALFDDIGTNVNQGSAFVFTRSDNTWTQQARLTVAGAAGDSFGGSVSLSGDTLVIGGYAVDNGALLDQGAAYVFARSGDAWTLRNTLRPPSPTAAAGDRFGATTCVRGDFLVIGAPRGQLGSLNDQGLAYVYRRTDADVWTLQNTLSAEDGQTNDFFGSEVGVSGSHVLVSAPFDAITASASGSAWIFSLCDGRWIDPTQEIIPVDESSGDQFGASLAVDGNTLVVGSRSDDGTFTNQGSVYVYVRSGNMWVQQAKVTAPDPGSNDNFGASVAISGETMVIGAPYDSTGATSTHGSAYVYVRSGTTWSMQTKVTAPTLVSFDQFGFSVAIRGDTVLVGSPFRDVGVNSNQGAVFQFNRLTSTTWSAAITLTASDGTANDTFGYSLALSNDACLVGAAGQTVSGVTGAGACYTYGRSGSTLTPSAKLSPPFTSTARTFGSSVAIGASMAVVGCQDEIVNGLASVGSAYVYTRSGTSWAYSTRLIVSDAAASESWGAACAINDDLIAVGAPGTITNGVALFAKRGSSWLPLQRFGYAGSLSSSGEGSSLGFWGSSLLIGTPYVPSFLSNYGYVFSADLPANDFNYALNENTNFGYASLAAAMTAAQSGHSLLASEAAWRLTPTIDTIGRSLAIRSEGDVSTASTSVISLGGASSLASATGGMMNIDGQLRIAAGASADLTTGRFSLGSRGSFTCRAASSATLNADAASLDGQVRLESASSLSLNVTNSPVDAAQIILSSDSTLVSNETIFAYGTLQATSAQIFAPLLINRGSAQLTAPLSLYTDVANADTLSLFGSASIFGSFTNHTRSTTTIRSGTLFVFGDLTNNGTVIGTICSTCSGLPPGMDVGGSLSLGSAANLTMPFVGSVVHVGGSFDCAIDSNTRFDMAQATLQLESSRPEVTLEVMSADIGVDPTGLDRSIAGHFPIGELHVGGYPTTVRLVDAYDNALDGTSACEALYVDTLRIEAGSRLINLTCRIYYNTLINDGVVDAPENLSPLQGTPCPADFNLDGGVDGGDVVDFFAAWENGDSLADVNLDGGVDGSDVNVFFAAWEAGGC